MHKHHRRALRRGMLSSLLLRVGLGADRVVEDDYALGADLGAHELGDVAIEVRADRVVVVPAVERRAKRPQREAFAGASFSMIDSSGCAFSSGFTTYSTR